MVRARLLLAATLLALLLGSTAGLAWWSQRGEGASGEFPVLVVGPDDAELARVDVRLENATALDALLAAADAAGLDVRTVEYPGMGTYVASIDGHAAGGAAGWVYEVRRGGQWIFGDRSAAFFTLEPGDEVRWRWSNMAR